MSPQDREELKRIVEEAVEEAVEKKVGQVVEEKVGQVVEAKFRVLSEELEKLRSQMATKEDLNKMATKEDLENLKNQFEELREEVETRYNLLMAQHEALIRMYMSGAKDSDEPLIDPKYSYTGRGFNNFERVKRTPW